MGERRRGALRVDFDQSIKLEFHGARVSSDAGLFPYRELDQVFGLTESSAINLSEFRTGLNIRHSMTVLLLQSVYSRLVAKVEWHQGELFPRVGFIVTNLSGGAKPIVDFYNQRGTAEQWIKEGKHAIRWTRRSCHSFDANQVCLQLHVLAYNLGNFLRRLALPPGVRHWSLTTLRDKLIKIGAKMVRHARYVTFQLAEVAIPMKLYRQILKRIRRFAAIAPRAAPT